MRVSKKRLNREGNGFMNAMYWDYSAPLSFKVVEKSTGKLVPVNYMANPMAFFHIINAQERDGHLLLDAPFKEKPISYDFMSMDFLKAPALSSEPPIPLFLMQWCSYITLWYTIMLLYFDFEDKQKRVRLSL